MPESRKAVVLLSQSDQHKAQEEHEIKENMTKLRQIKPKHWL